LQAVEAVLFKGESEFSRQLSHAADPSIAAVLYVPRPHPVQIPPLGPAKPELHVQDVSKLLPIGATECGGQTSHRLLSDAPTTAEYLPTAHGTQTVSTVAPAVEECVPATQPVHALFPASDLKVPIAHCIQLPPTGPVHPALQVQTVEAVLAGGEVAFAGQASQTAVPVTALNLPGTQPTHLPSLGDDPALQAQSASTLLAAGELDISGQDKHGDGPTLGL